MGCVRRLPLAAAVAVAVPAALIALGGAAGPAAAVPSPGGDERMTVTPAQIRPGGDLVIRTQSCGKARSGTVISAAFVAEAVLSPALDGGLFGSAVVSSGVRAGTYPVSVSCNGIPKAVEGRFTVVGQANDRLLDVGQRDVGQRDDGQSLDNGEPQSGGIGFPTPVAPVQAGGGGTARLAAESGTSGGGAVPGIVAAGVLITAGAAGLVAHRRRGRSRD